MKTQRAIEKFNKKSEAMVFHFIFFVSHVGNYTRNEWRRCAVLLTELPVEDAKL
jgi:hypothetical protein